MSKSTFSTESVLASIFENPWSLVIAAVLFSTGIGLSALSTFSLDNLAGFVTINMLLPQFIAGLLVSVGLVFGFSRKPLKHAIAGIAVELRAIAIAGTLWLVGMALVGIANAQGPFTPVGLVANLIGYAFLVSSAVLSGSLGAHIASSKTV